MELERRYVVENISWILRAIADGYDVRGYFYWTLMDNYEWNHGTGIKMGLYAVEPEDESKARRARDGVETYGRIAEEGALPTDLREQFLGD